MAGKLLRGIGKADTEMIKSWQHLGIAVILALGGAIATVSSVFAQSITIDGTLSPAQTLTGPVYTIPQSVGQTVGSNLFQSFGRFNLNMGEIANFQSALNIRNIFSRVTGGSRSLIDGLIFTNSANVNLFLINPSGIVFGPNASLNVGGSTRGSFVATTVDALVWSNGSQFSATNPGNRSSLLTIVGDPSGFLSTLRIPPPIDVNRSVLGVAEGQSLLLLGGNVNLDRSNLFVDFTEGGRIELGGVAEPGTVGLNTNGNILSLNFPENLRRGDVSLTNGANLDVTAGNGGSIAINARNVDILRGSQLLAGIFPGFGEPNAKAGNIEINAQEKVSVNNSAIRNFVIGNSVFPEARGEAGDIIINTGSLLVTNNAELNSSVIQRGKGNGGNIIINARGQVSFDGGFARSRLEAGGEGRGGDIRITTDGDVLVTGIPSNVASSSVGQLVTATFGNGDAGSVTIKAGDNVSFHGRGSDIFALVAQDRGVGNGGNITIDSNSLSITNGARLISSTEQQGNAGSINITTRDTIKLVGASISTNVTSGGNGNAGSINIKTGSLSLTNGAVLNSSTSGRGSAGNVIIDASDRISLDGNNTTVFSNVQQGAVGDGGDIRITTKSLYVTNGAQLLASTSGEGDAGNVQIKASNSVNISGNNSINGRSSALFTDTTSKGKGGDIRVDTSVFRLRDGAVLNARTVTDGNGGNITVNASQFQALSGGQLLSTTSGTGRAGKITVNATDSVIINGSDPTFNDRFVRFGYNLANVGAASGFFVQSSGSGIAGDIEVISPQIRLDNGGRFIAESASVNGGNIALKVGDLLLLRRGSLISTTAGTNQAGGNGGNISINSPFILAVPSENSDIRANAFSGNGGTVTINAQGIFGIQPRQQPTSQSDITASSTGGGINGVVDINTLEIDPSRGFINLPTNVVNTSRLVAQSCSVFGKGGSAFIVTGRGGLAPSPDDFLSSDVVWSDTRLTALPVSPNSRVTPSILKTADGVVIIPATGWVFNEKTGEVTLIASNASSEGVGSNQGGCIVP